MTADLSRRVFLGRAAGVGVAGALLPRSPSAASEGVEVEEEEDRQPAGTVVVLTLVGGLDGLAFLVPWESAEYRRLRPAIAIDSPGEPGGAIEFAGPWALHPAMAPLVNQPIGAGMAVIGGVGLAEALGNLSHRVALDELHAAGGEDRGWGAAALEHNGLAPADAWWFGQQSGGFFRGRPQLAGGARPTAALTRFDNPNAAARALRAAYVEDGSAADSVGAVLAATDRWRSLNWAALAPAEARGYPAGQLGEDLAATADMIRFDGGLRLIAIDHQGYDTHRAQGNGRGGVLAARLDELARSLAAFWTDLGEVSDDVSVVVVSELGRSVAENHRGGTNHADSGVALVLDAAAIPGVHGTPGSIEDGSGVGGWPITTVVHGVMNEVLRHRGWSVEDHDRVGLFSSSVGVHPSA